MKNLVFLKQITEFFDQQMPERNRQICRVNIERELLLNADQETSTALEVQTVLPLKASFKRGTFQKEWEILFDLRFFKKNIPMLYVPSQMKPYRWRVCYFTLT